MRLLFRILWTSFATAVIAAALVVGLARLLLSELGDHRKEIETWISRALEHPVAIDSIEARWHGAVPTIQVTGLRILDPTHSRVILRLDRGSLSIDPVASLWQGALVSRQVILIGVDLTLIRTLNGRIVAAGFTGKPKIATWLLRQRQVAIHSARVTWHDQKAGREPIILPEVTLKTRTQGDHQRLGVSVKLPLEMGDSLNLVLKGQGDLLSWEWSGELYLEGRGIKPAFLLSYSSQHPKINLTRGEATIRAWSSWARGELSDFQGDFTAASVDIVSHVDHLRVPKASGRFALNRISPAAWRLEVDQLAITTDNGPWPEKSTLAVVVVEKARNFMGYASFLRLQDLAPGLIALAPLSQDLHATLRRLEPRGELRETRFQYFPEKTEAERFSISTRFTGITTRPLDRIPGLKDIAGRLEANATQGLLQLSSSSSPELEFNKLFQKPLQLKTLAGDLRWHRQDHSWVVSTPGLEAANQDLGLKLSGDVLWAPKGGTAANLVVDLYQGRVDRASRYLPSLLPEKARNWLTKALVQGEITQGRAVLRGRLDQFPFREGQGEFKAALNIEGGVLEYAPRWPRIEGLTAQLLFQGRTLTIHAIQGKTSGIPILNTTARLALGSDQPLRIHGQAKGTATEAHRYVMSSPLKEIMAKRIEQLVIEGDLGLDLNLEIPLATSKEMRVKGTLSFLGNTVEHKQLGLELTDLSGELAFTQDKLYAEGVKARLFNRPVRIDVKEDRVGNWMVLKGTMDRSFLAEHLLSAWMDSNPVKSSRLFEMIEGETDWKAKLKLTPGPAPAGAKNLYISSSLAGLRIKAPAPLGKDARGSRPLVFKTDLADTPSRWFILEYGSDLKATVRLAKHQKTRLLDQASIQLGRGAGPPPKLTGLWVGGRLEEFSLSQWSSFLRTLNLGGGSQLKLPSTAIDVEFTRLEGGGNWFSDIHLTAHHAWDQWLVKIDGREASGTIRFPAANTITARFDRLILRNLTLGSPRSSPPPLPSSLPRVREGVQGAEFSLSRFPTLSFDCNQFIFRSFNLGKMTMTARPDPTGVRLESLRFTSPDLNIEAQGNWRSDGGIRRSRFDIKAKGPNLGRILRRFNYNTGALEGGRTQVEFQAQWPGVAADFALARLSGRLRIDIYDGQLPNVKQPVVGRVFGLLSIWNLPRRLALDFSDLFSKGYSFNKAEGVFNIENGQAYTNHLVMDGPSARIAITGRTGLAAHDYDLQVTVTPSLVSNLSAAGAFFGPVGAGVGAGMLLAQQVFPSVPAQIDRILQRRYTVTGSWEHPVIQD